MASAPQAGDGGLRPAFAAARSRLGLIVLLFALAAAGWWWTVDRMRGMDEGPGTDLGTLGWFLGVWIVMMAAMMLPSVSHGRSVFTHDQTAVSGCPGRFRVRLSAGLGRSRAGRLCHF
jgi:hypothetical protein